MERTASGEIRRVRLFERRSEKSELGVGVGGGGGGGAESEVVRSAATHSLGADPADKARASPKLMQIDF